MTLSKTGQYLLLAAVVSVGIGSAWISWLMDTAIGTLLFMNYGVSQGTSGLIMKCLSLLLGLATFSLFFKRTRIFGALIIFIYLVLLLYAVTDQGGYPYSEYAFAAYALRFAAPLAFLLVFYRSINQPEKNKQNMHLVVWIMILASSTTFFIHGLEALWAHPWFVDMTLTMAQNLSGWALSQSQAERILILVGVLDITSAIGLLIFRSKIAALWMFLWGFFTCLLRLVNFGYGAIPDVVIRFPHGLLPLILYLTFRKSSY